MTSVISWNQTFIQIIDLVLVTEKQQEAELLFVTSPV